MKLALHSRLALITLIPAFVLITLIVSLLTSQQLHGTDAKARADAEKASHYFASLMYYAARQQANVVDENFRWDTSQARFTELVKSALSGRARAVTLYHPDGSQALHVGAIFADTILPPLDQLQQAQVAHQASRFATRHRINGKDSTDFPAGWVEITYDFSDTRLSAYATIMINSGLAIFALIVLYFLVMHVARAAAEPIRRIIEATRYIRDGEYDTRIETASSAYEVRELEYTINQLVAELQETHEEMQQSIDIATHDLKTSLEGFERQNIKLEQSLREAQDAAKLKTRFLANISHEMRTPLNAIHGLSHLMAQSVLPKREQERMQTILASADWLLTLINDLLDYSKIEAHKLELEQREFNLREVVESVLSMLSPQAHQKRLDLALLAFEDVPRTIIGDEIRLKQVITNLVTNAIKFTDQGSVVVRVALEAEEADAWQLRLTVTDTGKGMTPEQSRKLFASYEQGASDVARLHGGTGLGLSISRKLIELMGGEIHVNSEPNVGSEFSITLRTGKTAEPAPEPPKLGEVWVCESNELRDNTLVNVLRYVGYKVNREASCADTPDGEPLFLGIDDPQTLPWQRLLTLKTTRVLTVVLPWHHEQAVNELIHEGIHTLVHPVMSRDLSRPVETVAQPTDQSQPCVLAVDDHPANLFLLKELLADYPVQLLTANGGHAAIDLASRHTIDLILMDIRMPDLDGVETMSHIRRMPQYTQLPIIAVTAHALADERRRLLDLGMSDYISKPINLNSLEQAMGRWLNVKHLSQLLPPEPPASTTRVFDPAIALRRAGGKAHLAEHMMEDFLSALPAMLDDVKAKQADPEPCLEAVHKLHGASKLCGLPKLSTLLERCEATIKVGKAYQAPLSAALEAAEEVAALPPEQWQPALKTAPTPSP